MLFLVVVVEVVVVVVEVLEHSRNSPYILFIGKAVCSFNRRREKRERIGGGGDGCG